MWAPVLSDWVLYLIHFTVSSLPHCIVWMNVFISALWLIFREIYCTSLFPVLGLAVPLWSPGLYRPSSTAWPFCCSTPGLAPSLPRSSVISTPSLHVPPLSFSIFTTRQNKARLFILTMKEKPNWLFLSFSSSLQLVCNEPWGSF